MSQSVARKEAHITDRAEDFFISGVRAIEVIGCGMVRATFFVNLAGEGGKLEAKPAEFAIVMPVAMMPDAIGKAMMALGRTVLARDNEIVVRH